MSVRILVACSPGEQRVAAVQDSVLLDYALDRPGAPDGVGDLHRVRIASVVPAMAGAFVALDGAEGFLPDVIHAHDWQASLVPVYTNTIEHGSPFQGCASILSIHNLGYQGFFSADDLPVTGDRDAEIGLRAAMGPELRAISIEQVDVAILRRHRHPRPIARDGDAIDGAFGAEGPAFRPAPVVGDDGVIPPSGNRDGAIRTRRHRVDHRRR